MKTGRNEAEMADDNEEAEARERSAIATELAELQQTINKHVAQRERLPQPLFWSLFHARISRLKALRARERALLEILNPD